MNAACWTLSIPINFTRCLIVAKGGLSAVFSLIAQIFIPAEIAPTPPPPSLYLSLILSFLGLIRALSSSTVPPHEIEWDIKVALITLAWLFIIYLWGLMNHTDIDRIHSALLSCVYYCLSVGRWVVPSVPLHLSVQPDQADPEPH